ncbi:MAG: hypothetical protein WBE34_07295 [Candidatus Nitrosopolaris sp.]|jgi:predicted transcriptional regulator
MLGQKVQNPGRSLPALKQALYILKCISEGQSRKDIVDEFEGDAQLVSIWIDFLHEHGWLVEENNNKLTLTEDGGKMIRSDQISV